MKRITEDQKKVLDQIAIKAQATVSKMLSTYFDRFKRPELKPCTHECMTRLGCEIVSTISAYGALAVAHGLNGVEEVEHLLVFADEVNTETDKSLRTAKEMMKDEKVGTC